MLQYGIKNKQNAKIIALIVLKIHHNRRRWLRKYVNAWNIKIVKRLLKLCLVMLGKLWYFFFITM